MLSLVIVDGVTFLECYGAIHIHTTISAYLEKVGLIRVFSLRQKRETSSPVIQMEYGDQISNGTWKANESIKKNSIIEDEAISPQPR